MINLSADTMEAEIGLQGLSQLYETIYDAKKRIYTWDVETQDLYCAIKTEEITFPFQKEEECLVDDEWYFALESYVPTYLKIQKSLVGSGHGSKLEIIFSEIDINTKELNEDTKDYSSAIAYDKIYSKDFRNLCLQALWLPLEAFSWQIDHVINLLYVDQLKAPIYNPTIELANSILNKTYTRLNLLDSLVEKGASSYSVATELPCNYC